MYTRYCLSRRLRRPCAGFRSEPAGSSALGLIGFLLVLGGAGAFGSKVPVGGGDSDTWLVRTGGLDFSSCETPALPARFRIDLARVHVREWRDRLLRTPPRLLEAYLSRPDPWMDELLPILKAHDVPSGFLYLALIESGWNPEARSSADAVGLWQFTPGTGRQYGLRIDDGTDDRTDERLATSAAGRYLRDLFDDFGSWELAAAAYNAGPARVRRALDSSGADDYWTLVAGEHLPPETRAYVPKLIAVVELAAERAAETEMQTMGLELD